MKALILVGGFGIRLRKIVFDRPKSMIPIAGIPFLEHQMRLLKGQGIKEIVLCVSYMSDMIKSYFGDGRKIGINITYSEEEIPMGTAGAIKRAEKYVDETFLVLNGDSYSHIDINKFLAFHHAKKSKFTISLTKASNQLDYGEVKTEDDKITGFVEMGLTSQGVINSGVYMFEPDIFDYIPKDQNVSLENQIFPKLIKEGLLYGYFYDGYFIDIGKPETYEQFKLDILNSIILKEKDEIREALKKIDNTGIKLVIVADENRKLIGTVTDKDITRFLVRGGSLNESLIKIANKEAITASHLSTKEEIAKLFEVGIDHIPILDDEGFIKDVEFYHEETIKTKSFPILRGRAPLRISFAGGGTDIPYFFDKYGGAVVSATIDKYCYATIVKRADKKIIIDSDITPELDVLVESIDTLKYDGKFDIIKAVINITRPDFGFELYLHNDIPPGRGLGSSASFAVLIVSLLNQLMDSRYNDYKIAEIAHRAEREELKIKGGWQDQFAAVSGGFIFIEFGAEKTIVYPLRLKEEIINELQSHLLLCYVGKSHSSTEIHQVQENSFIANEESVTLNLNNLKKMAIEVRDYLLTGHLEEFGRLFHNSWEIKKRLASSNTNEDIERLYKIGLKNGAYGGRLLGAGNGGYLLFFHQPKKRNQLKKSLESEGGEVTSFNFEFNGTKIWQVKEKF